MRLLLGALLASATAVSAEHELAGRDIALGQTLYDRNCASCHGADLEGQPDWRSPDENGVLPAPPHDETGHTWHHDNQLLFDYTALGGRKALAQRGIDGFNSGMPGFEGQLAEDEIWTILAYIRSTWPEHIQKAQADRTPPH
ncbi:c-type cytochrome [Sulfitobacter sabulilitoris]|uniref:Cytochrome c n=1 Tax=Sulfitobacter sabulilitoris TaxID=2562655 RepID=A0A5S3PBX4_9RHOB|nr:cytochrome c [Sulfitobacter sabulilitoris]TMM51173.1 cytochrome c [Sulfitobacter sabulilitoris]